MIDEYFQIVLQTLQASPYVKSHNVTFDRHPTLDNFPHHKHIDAEENVTASVLPDLTQVIREIEERLISA